MKNSLRKWWKCQTWPGIEHGASYQNLYNIRQRCCWKWLLIIQHSRFINGYFFKIIVVNYLIKKCCSGNLKLIKLICNINLFILNSIFFWLKHFNVVYFFLGRSSLLTNGFLRSLFYGILFYKRRQQSFFISQGTFTRALYEPYMS